MKRKYLFFDVDGTLIPKGYIDKVPPSTARALATLKENGHFLALATGRSQYSVIDTAKKLGIDNIVSDGGNGLTVNGELFAIEPLEKQLMLQVVNACLARDYPICVSVDNTPNFYSHSDAFNTQNLWGRVQCGQYNVIDNLDYNSFPEIHKLLIGIDADEEQNFVNSYAGLIYARYNVEHIIIEPENKFAGIEAMMKHLDFPMEDVVVFGDAWNDYEMFEKSPFSVAMGNAIPELKAIADFVTTDCDADGIEHACKHFGWI